MLRTDDLEPRILLAVLYNAAGPRGLGFLKYEPVPMNRDDADRVISERGSDILTDIPSMREVFAGPPYLSLDYVYGRPVKASLRTDRLDPRAYDGKHGRDWAARAIASYRTTGEVNSQEIWEMHVASLETGGREAREWLDEETRLEVIDHQQTLYLGPGEHAERIRAILRDIFGTH
ncbi:MAG TPA: hypothetical protein VD862_04845 [Candidatus Paceibacterota bacterium]|nr:hypothetical protein [Candidatus Paceibacterota bacterium]